MVIKHTLLSIYIGLFSCFLLMSASVFGQDTPRLYRPDWSIKLNPVAFIAYTPGIELGIERAISENATLHIAGSYLSDFGIFQGRNFEGYKLIGEYRAYNLFNTAYENGYTSFQFHFKKAFAQGSTYVDQANGSYQEVMEVQAENTSLDFLVANGCVLPISRRFSLDLSIVYGAKILSLAYDDFSDDTMFNFFDDSFFDFTLGGAGSNWFPVFRMQAKVNFELR